jgi:uncharacterized cupin superfamily protein
MEDKMDHSGLPKIVCLQDDGAAPESYRPAADRILAGDPLQNVSNRFSSADGRFNCGIWSCQPGKWHVVFSENEFCQLLEGIVIVTGDDGQERTFRPGDAFVMPSGFTGSWEVVEPARKYYAVYE